MVVKFFTPFWGRGPFQPLWLRRVLFFAPYTCTIHQHQFMLINVPLQASAKVVA